MLIARAMSGGCLAAATRQRREPEQTVLYRTVQAHFPAFFAADPTREEPWGWPAFVTREFEAYLRLRHPRTRPAPRAP